MHGNVLIVSCAKTGSVPVVVDTACDWVKPIYLTDLDIDVMDRQTKKNILAHNRAIKANCMKKPKGELSESESSALH